MVENREEGEDGNESRCWLEESQEGPSVTRTETQQELICGNKELSAELHRGSPGSLHAVTAAVAF